MVCCLEQILVLLSGKGSLVLQPSSVVGNTVDLLAVVIRDGVVDRGAGRVGAESLDVRVEILVFLWLRIASAWLVPFVAHRSRGGKIP